MHHHLHPEAVLAHVLVQAHLNQNRTPSKGTLSAYKHTQRSLSPHTLGTNILSAQYHNTLASLPQLRPVPGRSRRSSARGAPPRSPARLS
eukprot:344981-Rhodomonas_salina.1